MKRGSVLFLALLLAGCHKELVRLHAAEPPILQPSWILLESSDGAVSIGIPSNFHNALDRRPAPQLSMDKPTDIPPPDETGGDSSAANPSPSQGEQDVNAALERAAGDLNSISSQLEDQQHEEIVKHMSAKGLVVWAWDRLA